ncbi:MAG: glucose-6-phosphate dehydrogenase [Desulfobulbales bacterium]
MNNQQETIVKCQIPSPQEGCESITPGALSPCTLVIFGASGDLTARKLIPAFYNLYLENILPDPMVIVGCGRTEFSHEQFRQSLKASIAAAGKADLGRWDGFSAKLFYRQVAYDSQASYRELAAYLQELDRQQNTGGNRIFYLAVPPTLCPVITGGIGEAGLAREEGNANSWTRIVVEKPFGRDLQSALDLDRVLHASFTEEQIFRIDHYLAKETVQNILMFRFANTIFEPVWNRNYIDYVGILAAENIGVGNRAGYYEQAGVLRDMFQNHMVQLLALTAMEPPSLFEDDRVRDEKAKVARSIKPLGGDALMDNLVLGQYESGVIDDKQVVGYRSEKGVQKDSLTPTFAIMRFFVDNWRWQGVPFFVASGKRLARKETKIVVQFKKVPHSMFRQVLEEKIAANRLVLGIYPEEAISLTFQTKVPGVKSCLRPVTMDFKYYHGFDGPHLDAYAKVLLEVILGDHMLFWRRDAVELSWSYLTPILKACETCDDRRAQLHPYGAGSWGPAAALKWMRLMVNG